ncbi:MAG: hypothetical protein IKB72_04000 [Ruminococcus sp.]|nr:hypothetical protein [Ruminococcus sp.]
MKISRNKMFYFTAVIVVACVVASSVIAVMTTNTSVKAEVNNQTQAREITFVLGEKDGMVAAFVKDVEIPYIRTDTPVNSLPYDVQARLKEGIEFESEQEMKRMLDEFCS